jgi:hypothetical protein
MIEIIFIVMLTRNNGKICRKKNIKPFGYQLLTVLLWVVLEILGVFIGAIFFTSEGFVMYAFGILGAGIGAFVSYLIVKSLDSKVIITETLDSDFTLRNL